MLFRKKYLLILLAGSLAVPSGLMAENLNINIPLLDGKLRMEIGIPALILLSAGAMLIYGQTKAIRTFNKFVSRALSQADKAVDAQNKANKIKMGTKYKPLSQEAAQAIREQAYESFILDEASARFNIPGSDLKHYIDSLDGGTFEQKLTIARGIVDTLLVPQSSLDTVPGKAGGPAIRITSKTMIKYAVENGIKTKAAAGGVTDAWTRQATADGTLKTTTGSDLGRIGSAAGRVAGAAVDAAGKALGSASEGLYNVTADAAGAGTRMAADGLTGLANAVDPAHSPAALGRGPGVGGGGAPVDTAYARAQAADVPSAPRMTVTPSPVLQDLPTQRSAVGTGVYPRINDLGLARAQAQAAADTKPGSDGSPIEDTFGE